MIHPSSPSGSPAGDKNLSPHVSSLNFQIDRHRSLDLRQLPFDHGSERGPAASPAGRLSRADGRLRSPSASMLRWFAQGDYNAIAHMPLSNASMDQEPEADGSRVRKLHFGPRWILSILNMGKKWGFLLLLNFYG
jgi:hypothetical protein